MSVRRRIAEKMRAHGETLPKFMVVGASATVLTAGLLYFFTDVLGLFYVLSSLLSNQIGIFWNFIWHDNWTWAKRKKEKALLKRFAAFEGIYISSAIANTALLYVFTEFFKIYYIISMLIAVGILFMYNYAMHSRITFKERKP